MLNAGKCLFLASLWLTVNPAAAFVVQDGSALSFNNYGRDEYVSSKGAKAPTISKAAKDENIDNLGIANKLISTSAPLRIDLNSRSSQTIRIPNDYIFTIIIPEAADTIWHIDTNEKYITPLSTRREGQNRILEFKSLNYGQTKIYLDNLKTDSRPYQSLQSRVVRVRIIP